MKRRKKNEFELTSFHFERDLIIKEEKKNISKTGFGKPRIYQIVIMYEFPIVISITKKNKNEQPECYEVVICCPIRLLSFDGCNCECL